LQLSKGTSGSLTFAWVASPATHWTGSRRRKAADLVYPRLIPPAYAGGYGFQFFGSRRRKAADLVYPRLIPPAYAGGYGVQFFGSRRRKAADLVYPRLIPPAYAGGYGLLWPADCKW